MLPVLALLVSAVVTTSPAASPRAPEYPHIRSTDRHLAALIQEAVQRSATFAHLYRRLQESDVILFVERSRELPPNLAGRLGFLCSTPVARYLRAEVRAGLNRWDLIATIAHEMQHALEVAESWDVRDRRAFDALYRRIGRQAANHTFDTDGAYRVGVKVRAELIA